MNFLVDQNLPRALGSWLNARGHGVRHVADALSAGADDRSIAKFAADRGLIVISKDQDFVFLLRSLRHRLVWLRCGNLATARLLEWIEARWGDTELLLRRGERLIELR